MLTVNESMYITVTYLSEQGIIQFDSNKNNYNNNNRNDQIVEEIKNKHVSEIQREKM